MAGQSGLGLDLSAIQTPKATTGSIDLDLSALKPATPTSAKPYAGPSIGPAPSFDPNARVPVATPKDRRSLSDKILEPVAGALRTPGEGLTQAVVGAKNVVTGGETRAPGLEAAQAGRGRVQGAIDVLSGGMAAGTPWLLQGLVTAPVQTIRMLAAGIGTGEVVNKVGQATNRDPLWTELASLAVGLYAGVKVKAGSALAKKADARIGDIVTALKARGDIKPEMPSEAVTPAAVSTPTSDTSGTGTIDPAFEQAKAAADAARAGKPIEQAQQQAAATLTEAQANKPKVGFDEAWEAAQEAKKPVEPPVAPVLPAIPEKPQEKMAAVLKSQQKQLAASKAKAAPAPEKTGKTPSLKAIVDKAGRDAVDRLAAEWDMAELSEDGTFLRNEVDGRSGTGTKSRTSTKTFLQWLASDEPLKLGQNDPEFMADVTAVREASGIATRPSEPLDLSAIKPALEPGEEKRISKKNLDDVLGTQPEDSGVVPMNGERVRQRYGMEPAEAVKAGLVTKETNEAFGTVYRVKNDTMKRVGSASTIDTLPSGEVQNRLPGDVGQVRDTEVSQPKVAKVPEQSFDLKPPAETVPQQSRITDVKDDVVGKLVQFTEPTIHGPSRQAGMVTRVMPDGSYEIRKQLGGYKVLPREQFTLPAETVPAQGKITEAPAEPTPAKEPWQMKRGEYVGAQPTTREIQQMAERGLSPGQIQYELGQAKEAREVGLREHKAAVEAAIKSGQSVPKDVLAEYPELERVQQDAAIDAYRKVKDAYRNGEADSTQMADAENAFNAADITPDKYMARFKETTFKDLPEDQQREIRRMRAELEEGQFQQGQSSANDSVASRQTIDPNMRGLDEDRFSGESSASRNSFEANDEHPNLKKHTPNAEVYHDLNQYGATLTNAKLRAALDRFIKGGEKATTLTARAAIRTAERRLGQGAPDLSGYERPLGKEFLPESAGDIPVSELPVEERTKSWVGHDMLDSGFTREQVEAAFKTDSFKELVESVKMLEDAKENPEYIRELALQAAREVFGTDTPELSGGIGAVGPMASEAAKIVKSSRAGRKVSDVIREARMALSPKDTSPEGRRASDILRNTLGDINNAAGLRRAEGADHLVFSRKGITIDRGAESLFRRNTDERNIKIISEYERTGKLPSDVDPRLAQYADRFKASMDLAHKWLEKAYGEDVVGYIDNYVRHAFKFRTPEDSARGVAAVEQAVNEGRKTLSANRTVLGKRKWDLPLDQVLDILNQRGIEVTPAETNPERIRQWTLNNAYKAMRYKELGDQLKGEKLIRYVPVGKVPEPGMSPLNDRRFQVFFKTEDGLLAKGGSYYAPAPVAKLLNRVISTGMSKYTGLRGLQHVNNAMNQVQLGLSAFHAVETAVNSAGSDWALGLRQLAAGRYVPAAESLIRGAVPGVSGLRHLVKGRAFRNALADSDPAALKVLDEVVNKAGGRLTIEDRYRTQFIKNFSDALHNASWSKTGAYQAGKAVVNAPMAFIEFTAKPLMEYAIPRIKVGAYLDLAAEVRAQMPNASQAQLAHAYGKAWNSIDNRFGLLTYDNLFWNRWATDIGQLMFRSLGWNHGTELELGGGAKDAAILAAKLGKSLTDRKGFSGVKDTLKQNFTDRTAFTIALTGYIGTLGYIYHYLHTGEAPKDIKDLYYPKDGTKDASGNDNRNVLKSYVSDVASFAHDPIRTVTNKLSPLVSMSAALAQNRNFFNDLVRNPDDPKWTQLAQTGKFIAQSLPPISFTQIRQAREENRPIEQSVERGFAITKAPTWITQGAAQQEAAEIVRKRMGERPSRTPEQVELDRMKTKARKEVAALAEDTDENNAKLNELLADPKSALAQYAQAGGFKPTASQDATDKLIRFVTEAPLSPADRLFKMLTNEERLALAAKYAKKR